MALRIVWGVVSILFGILVLVWPGMSLGILVIIVGIWAIIIGILEIMASIGIAPSPTADGSGASSAEHWQSCSGSWCSSGPAPAWSASSGSSASGPLSGASRLSFSASNSARPPAPPRPVLRRPLESDSASCSAGKHMTGSTSRRRSGLVPRVRRLRSRNRRSRSTWLWSRSCRDRPTICRGWRVFAAPMVRH